MTSATSSRLPRLLPGIDLRGLPISPAEAFVVSRVDGATSVAEIAEETGKPIDEVQGLLAQGYGRNLKAMNSIGYKEATAFLAGEYSRDEAARLIKRNTRHYAKRQFTWFNSVSDIIWLEYPENFDTISFHAIEFIARQEA